MVRGDDFIVEEDGNTWPFSGSPRRPQRLVVRASLVWLTTERLRVRLPRVRVVLNGEVVVLPPTERELPRLHRESSGALGGIGRAQGDPSEWLGIPFYPAVGGVCAAARTATYYSHEAWETYQRVLYDKMPREAMPSPDRSEGLEAFAALLAVSWDADEREILAAFREQAKRAHPDVGGKAEHFHRLTRARDALISAVRELKS